MGTVQHPQFIERCRKLERELPALSGAVVRSRLMTIGVMDEDMERATRVLTTRDEEARRHALGSLAVAIFSDRRLERVHAAAARLLTGLDIAGGRTAMFERWVEDPKLVRARDAYVAWVRLDRPDLELHARALCEALAADLEKAKERDDELERLDKVIASIATDAPAPLVRPLLVSTYGKDGLRATRAALGARIVTDIEDERELIALLDDKEVWPCQDPAAEKLAAMSEAGARWILAHNDRANHRALANALRWISPAELYDVVAPRLAASNDSRARQLWFAVLETPGAPRDRRWLERADPADSDKLHGIAMLIAMARDHHNPFKDDATRKIAAAMEAATRDGVEGVSKSLLVSWLGQTGNAAAVPALLRELAHPLVGFGRSSVIEALGTCAGVDVIPTIEHWQNRDPSLVSYCVRAIANIHAHPARLEACDDPDPVLADLARRAQNGDRDAILVLDDTLRDRGRLPP